jgi:hypothetical protein
MERPCGRPQWPLDLALGCVQVVLIVGTARDCRWAWWLARPVYGLRLLLPIGNGWGPYLVGAPPEVQAAHARLFGRTKALPPMGDPPAPDANHRVLQGLLGLVALLGSPRRRASAAVQ